MLGDSRELFLEGRETSSEVLREAVDALSLPAKTQGSWAGPRAAPPGGRRRPMMAKRVVTLGSET